MFERKAGDPPLPVTDGIKPPDRVRGRLGVELMICCPVTARRLREVSAELVARGFLNERRRPFTPKSVAVMLAARAQ